MKFFVRANGIRSTLGGQYLELRYYCQRTTEVNLEYSKPHMMELRAILLVFLAMEGSLQTVSGATLNARYRNILVQSKASFSASQFDPTQSLGENIRLAQHALMAPTPRGTLTVPQLHIFLSLN